MIAFTDTKFFKMTFLGSFFIFNKTCQYLIHIGRFENIAAPVADFTYFSYNLC